MTEGRCEALFCISSMFRTSIAWSMNHRTPTGCRTQKVPTGRSWTTKEEVDKSISGSLSSLVAQVATHYAVTQQEGQWVWSKESKATLDTGVTLGMDQKVPSRQMEQQSQKVCVSSTQWLSGTLEPLSSEQMGNCDSSTVVTSSLIAGGVLSELHH